MNHFNYRGNILYAEEVDLRILAEKVGTPCYVYSRATLERHWHAFDKVFSDLEHLVCYAVKANSTLGVLNVLAKLGSGFDIVSVGELERVLIAGGEGKGADFSSLREVADSKLRAAVLIGRDAHVLADALQGVTEIVFAENMEQAVVMAVEQAEAGDDVLLSPACASFDMYQDYRQRGDDFAGCVRALQQEANP